MISAPNHQQLLSGNKTSIFSFYTLFSIIAIFAIVLLASCGSGRTKTPQAEIVTPQGTKVYNPATGRYEFKTDVTGRVDTCLLYTSPSPRDATLSRMPSSA